MSTRVLKRRMEPREKSRAIYKSMRAGEPESGTNLEELGTFIKNAKLFGAKMPSPLELNRFGPKGPGMGHFNGVGQKLFDPWPTADGTAGVTDWADGVARHAEEGLFLTDKLFFDGKNVIINNYCDFKEDNGIVTDLHFTDKDPPLSSKVL